MSGHRVLGGLGVGPFPLAVTCVAIPDFLIVGGLFRLVEQLFDIVTQLLLQLPGSVKANVLIFRGVGSDVRIVDADVQPGNLI